MCKLPVSEEPHLWPLLQTELWVEMAKLPKAVSFLHHGQAGLGWKGVALPLG